MWSEIINGQKYTFMNKREYSAFTGEGLSTLEKNKNHPARVKLGARLWFCPQLHAAAILSNSPVSTFAGFNEEGLLKAEDFEDSNVIPISGGMR